jgi:hypothetical protein
MLTTESAAKKKAAPRRLQFRTLLKLALLAVFAVGVLLALQIIVPAVEYGDDLAMLLNYSDD